MQEIHEAIKLMEQNKTEEAIERLETYLPLANEEEKYTIGELYMQWGMLEEAKYIFQALSDQYPNEAELKILLAEIHTDLDEDEEAIDVLNRFSPEDEEYMESLVQLADLYQAQGLYEVSEQKLLEAKNFDPSEPVIDFALGELAFSTGEYQKSIPYYEKVAEVQPILGDIEIAARLAEAYAATGEFEKAIDYYQGMESENPDNLFKYGFTAYRAERPDIAIKVWEQLIKSDPYYQSVYLYLAQTYEDEGMLEEAYETAKKGLQADEFNKELYHLAGVLAHKLGHQVEGYKLVEEAVAMDPGFKEAVLFLIETYKEGGDYEAIVELLTGLIDNGEEDANYNWELARAYQETESYQDALIQYQTAYNSFTEDSDFLKEYGYFLVEEGRTQEAKEVFAKYLQLEPSDTEIEEYLSRLNDTEEF
ncbi:tetratricopeptide repeat protein [Virgibacillus senegalensis]|uniref:tetratricopeptide repeat protein n=1 Tax=Virgibacillus senegalensis TaxID=1499679 RepID=UPI00069F8817|nr:tetratricopeptide repeat protein [Virgibacillus senegalensis]